MKYSIATSWDREFIPQLANLNAFSKNDSIAEIFGSHRYTKTGTGRPASRLPDITDNTLEGHVAQTRKAGMVFNYLLNAPSLGELKTDSEWWNSIREDLQKLLDIGVQALTITDTELLIWVLREFPDFEIRASLIAGIDSPDDALRYEDLGVSVICLSPFTVNRDFVLIESIRKAVTCELELYANISCVNNCPWWRDHYQLLGQRSLVDSGDPEGQRDPFLQMCSSRLLESPGEVLAAPFIRPEDVGWYSDLGIDRLKLSDRGEPTAFLVKTATAYINRRFTGDLTEIIFRSGSKFKAALTGSPHQAARVNVPFAIDNAALSEVGFMAGIAGRSPSMRQKFYEEAASRAVHWDAVNVARWRKMLSEAGAWGYFGNCPAPESTNSFSIKPKRS